MSNNLTNNKNTTDFILMGFGILFVLLFLVIVYYGLFGVNAKPKLSNAKNVVNKPTEVPPPSKNKDGVPSGFEKGNGAKPQVFHVKDNIFTYDDAEAVCKAYGAELATYQQLVDAWKNGANWCSKGWVKDQLALFPVQKEYWDKVQENEDENARKVCGVGYKEIQGGYETNKNLQFGVNCFGDKRGPVGDERMKHEYVTDKERALRQKIAMFQKQLGNFRLAPFNEDKWGSCPGK